MANKVKVQQRGIESLSCTIPSSIAQAMRLKKGNEVEWLFINGEVCVRKA